MVDPLSKSKTGSETVQQSAELERQEAELRKRILALEDSERRSTEFLRMLAHELRNPLAPIRNSLHILKLTCGMDPEVQEALGIIDRQMQALIRLIDDIHEVSRIARG